VNKREFEERIGFEVSSECYERVDFVYTYCPFFSEVDGKNKIAEFYLRRNMNGIERLYKVTLGILRMEKELNGFRKEREAVRRYIAANWKKASATGGAE
jgi:hypothetical protein